ncbi:TPA: hypothetical protein ACUBDY_001695 [Escherichia coli]
MLFIKAKVKKENGEEVFSQARNEVFPGESLKVFVEELKKKHGSNADFYFDDIHYI